MTSSIEAQLAKARESIAAAQLLIKEYAETACELAVQFISAAEVLLQRRKEKQLLSQERKKIRQITQVLIIIFS
jgi:hypothetical protein